MLEARGAPCIGGHLHQQYHGDRQYDGEELHCDQLVGGAFHDVAAQYFAITMTLSGGANARYPQPPEVCLMNSRTVASFASAAGGLMPSRKDFFAQVVAYLPALMRSTLSRKSGSASMLSTGTNRTVLKNCISPRNTSRTSAAASATPAWQTTNRSSPTADEQTPAISSENIQIVKVRCMTRSRAESRNPASRRDRRTVSWQAGCAQQHGQHQRY